MQLVKQMVHSEGGLFPLYLRMSFSTSPLSTTLNNSSDQQAANVPPAAPLTSCHLTIPARSLANTTHLMVHGQKGGYVCTAHPAQQGQQCKTCLRVSPVRLAKAHMPSQRTQLIWRRWKTTFKAEPQQLWKAIQVSSVWPSTGSKNHLNPPGKWPGLCYLYWLHPSTSSCFPCHGDVFLLSFTAKTAHDLEMDRRMDLASNLASRLARSITVFYGYNCRLQDQICWIVIRFYIHHTSRTKVNWCCTALAEKLWLWYAMCM